MVDNSGKGIAKTEAARKVFQAYRAKGGRFYKKDKSSYRLVEEDDDVVKSESKLSLGMIFSSHAHSFSDLPP